MELICKGKSKKTGKWVFGSYIYFKGDAKKVPAQKEISQIWNLKDNIAEDVWPETVCVYINRKDNKGLRIYSNDIVLVTYSDNGEEVQEEVTVSYDTNCAGFTPFSWQYSCEGCDCSVHIRDIEVIGNKFNDCEKHIQK